MKKKIISVVLAVCMLTTLLATSMIAFAMNTSTYNVDVKAEGKTVTVTIILPGSVKAAGANCTLQYDNSKLEFEKTIENHPNNVVNPNYRENSVRFSFSMALPCTTDTVLWKMTFTLKSGTVSANDFEVTAFKLYDENSSLISSEKTAQTAINFSCTHAATTEQVTTTPTHTDAGAKNIVCAVCGETISTESIPALGHTYGEWTVKTAPTCTEKGVEERSCSCGATETREVAAKGHTPGEWVVTTAPTCTEKGVETQKCAVCGTEMETREIAAKGHTAGEWKIVKEATCTEVGEKTSTCTVCNEAFTEEIPALGHKADKWEIVKEATCTEDGEKKSVCTVCEEEFTERIPALGHTFGEWKVVKEATETEEGMKERVCSVCGETEKETLPKLPVTPDVDTPIIPPTGGEAVAYSVAALLVAMCIATGVGIVVTRNKKRKVQ